LLDSLLQEIYKMSGFDTKNPWASNRMPMNNSGNFGNNMAQQQSMQGMMANQAMAAMNMAGGGISYPIRQQQSGGFGQQQQNIGASNGTPQQQNRVFTGTVTKLHENFGFIDDDVFFSTNHVKGACPKVGDRVLAEAVYNPSMPFKWNATRVTPMPTPGMNNAPQQQQRGGSSGGGGFGSAAGRNSRFGDLKNNVANTGRVDAKPRDRDLHRDRPRQRSPIRRDDRKRDDNNRPSRELSSRKRSLSKSKSRSPPRRKPRHAPRYNVSVPKVCLKLDTSAVMDLKKRYSSLYIPSDFFSADHVWGHSYPLDAPFKISMPSSFCVMNKEYVTPITSNRFKFDPKDADYSYVAKVMLIASPGLEDLFDKTCHFVEKDTDDNDARDGLVHPSRAIKFLVGLKGKSETMAVGGPWSPSLDGKDPVNDPTVLIKTAIRTCGAMTGIDLSACTQWTRFMEFYYRRQPTGTKPARTEVVVLFLPDVWSAMPGKEEYDDACDKYATNCELKLAGKPVPVPEPHPDLMEEEDENGDSEGADGPCEPKGDPSHWKELDPKTMKVNDLKVELEARGQNSKGLKSQLQARLQKIIQQEEEAETKQKDTEGNTENTQDKEEADADKEKEEEELDERTKDKIKSSHKTSSTPCIFVHPNTEVKSGKFDCRVESLSVLLDYRHDDNKEGTFEVSLFAELFNEMMMRDHAFNVYKAIMEAKAPEKKVKEKKDGEKEDDKDKEKDKEEKQSEDKKMVTYNKDLLLSCSYFDLSHCGYFEAKDLEDIFLALELALSRAEVKKLSLKLAQGHKETVNYRSLVDIEQGSQPPKESDADSKKFSTGFRQFLPGRLAAAASGGSDSAGGADSQTSTPQTNKLVKFRGSVIDLEKLTQKLEKAERLRNATESQLLKAHKELGLVNDQKQKLEQVKDKLTTQLKETKQQVVDQELQMMSVRGDNKKSMAAMKDVYLRIKPFVEPKEEVQEKPVEAAPVKQEPKIEVPKKEEPKTQKQEVPKKVEEKKEDDNKEEEKKEEEATSADKTADEVNQSEEKMEQE